MKKIRMVQWTSEESEPWMEVFQIALRKVSHELDVLKQKADRLIEQVQGERKIKEDQKKDFFRQLLQG